jgi:GntR family transcriptional regulator, transcriptional repressor for pyruvate dehydrogenase complex
VAEGQYTMERSNGQANLGFSQIGNLSTTVAAITQIEALIRRGELRPGDRMPPERELAELLGVSRPTVREALRALSILGIVRSRHGSGNYLGTMDEQALQEPLRWLLTLSLPAQDVDAVLQFRMVLESGLARLAAERISEDALDRLRDLLGELEAATSDEEVLRADMKMHAVIAEEANNPLLLWMLNAAVELNVAARSRTVRVPGVKAKVASDQRAIVDALEKRDGNEAAEAMWRHLRRISTAYNEYSRRHAATEDRDTSTP